jgi:regulator of protease activity HflC (stomatin/prohibitin superfamily)
MTISLRVFASAVYVKFTYSALATVKVAERHEVSIFGILQRFEIDFFHIKIKSTREIKVKNGTRNYKRMAAW